MNNIKGNFAQPLSPLKSDAPKPAGIETPNNGVNFADMLQSSIDEVNTLQEKSQEVLGAMASGQVKDLHQAAIAIGRAESSMKVMLEVRNKALSAYKEILRTQI